MHLANSLDALLHVRRKLSYTAEALSTLAAQFPLFEGDQIGAAEG
jgi:hypothetical protein